MYSQIRNDAWKTTGAYIHLQMIIHRHTTVQFYTQKSKNLSEMKDLLFLGVLFFFSNKDFQCAETIYSNNWEKSLWEIIGMNFQGSKLRPA